MSIAELQPPLCMTKCSESNDASSTPKSGVDYIYDDKLGRSTWVSPAFLSTSCSTASKGKVDDSKNDD